jgi:hypothetical protein
VRSFVGPALTTIRPTILHSITIMVAALAADIMDMDKAECSLPVRHLRRQDNKTYAFE